MKYADLLNSDASPTQIQSYLVDSDLVPVTIRIPKNLRDAAKESATLSGMTFTSFVKRLMIEELSKKG